MRNRVHPLGRVMVLSFIIAFAALIGCSSSPKPQKRSVHTTPSYTAIGLASYYGRKFHGRSTASGERFNMHAMTAAHPSLPFGTRVRVTRLSTGREVIVRINDRGPFVQGRIIDLSYAAAKQLDMLADGLTRVRITLP